VVLAARTRAAQLARLVKLTTKLPEVDVVTVKHSTFVVRSKKFAYYLVDHHGDGRVSLECKADRGTNAALVDSDRERFFLPKYMAHHGWVGLYLDVGTVDWDEIEALLEDAYRLTAPKSLVRLLDVTGA
jgi:hypothetical protein